MERGEPNEPRSGFFGRAARILLRPSRGWDEIEREAVGVRALHARYVVPLAAVPAVCGAVGVLVFGFNLADVRVRPTPTSTALEAVAGYLLTLVSVWLLAGLINLLAPAFGGVRSGERAFKLVAYSGTAAWGAGIFFLYPSLQIPVGLLAGVYSLYTLYLGLPKLMRAPPERALTYYGAVVLAVAALALATAVVSDRAAELGGPLALG